MRCSRCGAEAPEDAAWCQRCGKPVELEILDLGGDGDAGTRPPVETGKDRRPVAVAALVVAVLLAGLMLTSGASGSGDRHDEAGDGAGEEVAEPATSSRRSTSTTRRRRVAPPSRRSTTTTLPPPVAAEPVGARLVMLRHGEMTLVDIDANAVVTREVQPLDLGAGGSVGAPVAAVRGDHLVFQAPDGAWVIGLEDDAPPRLLAPSLVMLPAVDADEVWLVEGGARGATIQRWRTDGSQRSVPYDLPVDWTPMAEVEGGLVLRRGDGFQVWDPASGTTVAAGEPDARTLAAHGRTVAWTRVCESPLCALHLTDVVTGVDRTSFLGRTQVDWGVGAFSPDGRWLALRAHEISSQQTWNAGVALVDVATGASRFEEVPSGQSGTAVLEWSPDGRWLFLLPQTGTPERGVVAYSPERDVVVELQLPRGAGGFSLVAY